MTSLQERREEIIARTLYRIWMEEDFEQFPWDAENEPSNETEREAREYAVLIVQALESEYATDDEKFDRVVAQAAREKLQTLVATL